ncbi:hypothetical protein CAJAP_08639 [Camponotus japonicus]
MNTMNQSRKPQESLFATKDDVVRSTSRKDILEKIRKTSRKDILEKIRKWIIIADHIQKSILSDYEKDSTTKPLDYGKLSKRSINQPRKPQESFLGSTKHNIVQFTSRKDGTDDETIWDICERIRKTTTPTTDDLIQKSIFPDYEKDSTTKTLDYGKLSKRSINQPRKPQESFLGSTKHNIVQFTSRKDGTDDETIWDICERIRKTTTPTTDDLIQKSIFPDYEKDSTTKTLDYGKLSKRSINQPRKPQESFLGSTRHNVDQSTSRKDETDDETIWDISRKILKMPSVSDLIQKSIFPNYEKDYEEDSTAFYLVPNNTFYDDFYDFYNFYNFNY